MSSSENLIWSGPGLRDALRQALCALVSVPRVVRKPRLGLHVIASARMAQVALVAAVLFIAVVAPLLLKPVLG